MLTIQELQAQQFQWARKNFGPCRPRWPLLGVFEEIGELAHATLKQEQGIRGTFAEHEAAKKDAVADTLIYLIEYASCMEWQIVDLLVEEETTLQELQDNMVDCSPVWDCLAKILILLENKEHDGHDILAQEDVVQILLNLCTYCRDQGWSLQEIVETTWLRVSQRDWTKNKENGGDTIDADLKKLTGYLTFLKTPQGQASVRAMAAGEGVSPLTAVLLTASLDKSTAPDTALRVLPPRVARAGDEVRDVAFLRSVGQELPVGVTIDGKYTDLAAPAALPVGAATHVGEHLAEGFLEAAKRAEDRGYSFSRDPAGEKKEADQIEDTVFTCPQCGSHAFGSTESAEGLVRMCHGDMLCGPPRFTWPISHDDKYMKGTGRFSPRFGTAQVVFDGWLDQRPDTTQLFDVTCSLVEEYFRGLTDIAYPTDQEPAQARALRALKAGGQRQEALDPAHAGTAPAPAMEIFVLRSDDPCSAAALYGYSEMLRYDATEPAQKRADEIWAIADRWQTLPAAALAVAGMRKGLSVLERAPQGHSMSPAPCNACGDLDGCHLPAKKKKE